MNSAPTVELDRATLVAWCADKPACLVELIDRLQRAAGRALGQGFTPRAPTDVHATVLGLEAPVPGVRRDFDGVLRYLAAELDREPLDVQFGGFADTDLRMLSGGKTLHVRSLVEQGPRLVLVGWPMAPDPAPRLGEIRRQCERYGFRHKYHRQPDDADADAYLVLGDIAQNAHVGAAGLVEQLRGEVLATPVRVSLAADDVSLVEYVDPRLPAATSRRWPLVARGTPP